MIKWEIKICGNCWVRFGSKVLSAFNNVCFSGDGETISATVTWLTQPGHLTENPSSFIILGKSLRRK